MWHVLPQSGPASARSRVPPVPIVCVLVALLSLVDSGFAMAQQSEVPSSGETDEDATASGETDEGEAEAAGETAADEAEPGGELETPPPPSGSARRRVVVLVLGAGGVDPDTADALTELAIGTIARRGGLAIVGKEELQSRLGQSEEGSLECVSSSACLGRIGVELGVDEVVAGTVARRGDAWVFNLNRIDIRSGDLAGRAFREVDGDVGALADALQRAVPELFEALRRPSTLLISANVEGAEISVDGRPAGVFQGSPLRLEEVPPGSHELRASAPGRFDWTRTVTVAEGAVMQIDAFLEAPEAPSEGSLSPLVLIGGGAVLAGLGVAAGFGLASMGDPESGLSRAESVAHVDARGNEALVANIGFGVAAAGLVALTLGLLTSDFGGGDAEAATAAGVAVDAEGRPSVHVRGRF